MKVKKLCKTLISLALTLALALSVCMSGLTVFATENTDVTVNVYDGTVKSGYTGGKNALNATAGISGILDGKQVERIVPQYDFSDFKQYSIMTKEITEDQIDFAAVKNFSIFFKNDLGDGISLNLNEYANTNADLGVVYHSNYFSTGTVYWMVDLNENTAKRYFYRDGGYIYIPNGFEGYLIFDLTTCDADALSTFLACGLKHLKFRLKDFSEKTIGNAFYYGDINLSTVAAENAVAALSPNAVKQYVAVNPVTDNAVGIRKINLTPEIVINDYIGQTYKLNVPNSSEALFGDTIFTAAESKDCEAIIIPCKTNSGIRPEIAISPIVNGSVHNRYGYLKTKYTTINLLNDNVVVSDAITNDAVIEDTEFEGYIIAYIDADTKVSCAANTELGITKGDYSWSDFITYYKDYEIAGVFRRSNGSVVNAWQIGELSYVKDVDTFLAKALPNEQYFDPQNAPAKATFSTGDKTGTMEIVNYGGVLGNAYTFTVPVDENGENASSFTFINRFFEVSEYHKNMEALVYRIKIKNGSARNRSLTMRVGGTGSNFLISNYTAYNTLTGEVIKTTAATDSIKLDVDEFEGYIVWDLTNAKVGASAAKGVSWSEYVDAELADDAIVPGVWKSNAAWTADACNDIIFGGVSLVSDAEEFLAEILPKEEIEEPDDNQSVAFDPSNTTTDNNTVVKVDGKNVSDYKVVDGGDVLGNAYEFSVSEENADKSYSFRFDIFTASADLAEKEGLVYRIKASNSIYDKAMLNIKIGGNQWANNFASSYILVNTLTGEIIKSEEPDHRIYIHDKEFEGYVILDLTDGHFSGGTGSDWKTFINGKTAGTVIGAITDGSNNAALLNDLTFGEITFVNDINEFIDKATAPEKAGDANDDGIVDIRDLIRIKKYIADSTNTVINIFNSKLDDKGNAPNAYDLVAVRRMLFDNGSAPVSKEIGMAVWGMNDLGAWDELYGEIGAARDVFNYATVTSIEDMRANAKDGAAGWFKVGNPFADSTTTEMNQSYIKEIENRVKGYKIAGVWDNIVGFYTEEIRGKITDEQYKILTKYLSVKYPGKRIAACLSIEEVVGTEAFYTAKGEEIPEGRNITPANFDTYQYTTDIAYDQYFTLDKAKYQEYNAILAENLAGLKYRQWYMPATYIQNDLSAEELVNRETFMINHLNLMYELLNDDIAAGKDVGGLWLYGWHTYIEDGENGSVFLDKMNQYGTFSNLITRIAQIGKEINEMNDKY